MSESDQNEYSQIVPPAPAGTVVGEWVCYEKTAKKRASPATKAWWSNNPGNLVKSADYPNKIGDDGTWAIFATYEDGAEAVLLKVAYHERQGQTLRQMGDIWCEGCNYGATIARLMNEDDDNEFTVTADTKLSDVLLRKVADAIIRQEGGREGVELDRSDSSLPARVRFP